MQIGTLKVNLKEEEDQASDPQDALNNKRWDRLVDLNLARETYAAKRVKMAEKREQESGDKAEAKQRQAMRLQRQADEIMKVRKGGSS